MYRMFLSVLVAALLLAACGGLSDEAGQSTTSFDETASTVTSVTMTFTTEAITTTSQTAARINEATTTTVSYTSTELPGGVELRAWWGEPTAAGFRGDELLFTLTQSCGECFAGDRPMTREPGGVLSNEGKREGVWTVNESGQTEIHHLWPTDNTRMDVLWLTNYSGATLDTLTGFTPEPGDTFTLFDEIVLEPRGTGQGHFGLHADCRINDGDVGAALLSFEGETPVALVGWMIDYDTMTFVELDDAASLQYGACYQPAPRP